MPLDPSAFIIRTWAALGAPGHQHVARAQQAATANCEHPVRAYGSVRELTAAAGGIAWTEDPLHGRLDLLRHPTAIQAALDCHAEKGGDCEDISAYYAAALLRSGLSEDVSLVACWWRRHGVLRAHALCLFSQTTPQGNDWWLVSNWNRCLPWGLAGPRDFPGRVAREVRSPVVASVRFKVQRLRADDTLIFD